MALDAAQIRPAVLAGSWYPGDPSALTRMVDDFLSAADDFNGAPKAIIAPHAGFIYSGPIAGTAYAALKARRGEIKRVVMLGPCHRVPVRGFGVPSFQAFATPLGVVPVDRESVEALLRLPDVALSDEAHLPEHCLETQLPFLQRMLGDFSIVPILVGGVAPARCSQLLEMLWGGKETLIEISSDLSHYHPYDEARQLDEAACHAIESLAPEDLHDEQACGRHAIYGLLGRGQALDLRATTLDLRNSGDTAGRGRSDGVVGYSAIAFEDAARARLTAAHRRQLLKAAGQTIAAGLSRGKPPEVAVESYPWPLRSLRATFVTLKMDGHLRGCVGSIKPHQPLVADVSSSAYKAAFGDRRFKPLKSDELNAASDKAEISVSILSRPRPMEFESEAEAVAQMKPGVEGYILREKGKSGLLLPQVWEGVPDSPTFLKHLKVKAGLDQDHWSDDLNLFRFGTESFGARLKQDPAGSA